MLLVFYTADDWKNKTTVWKIVQLFRIRQIFGLHQFSLSTVQWKASVKLLINEGLLMAHVQNYV